MTEDRIERETLISAPLERVWSLVAAPGFWVYDKAPQSADDTVVAAEGQSVVVNHPEYGDFPVEVVKVEPQTYLAYRWASAFPGEPVRDDNSTLIEFTLASEGDQTRLKVVESGFAALVGGEQVGAKAHADNTGGWKQVIDDLVARAERASV
ncbi:SRPBCC family protein [Intrasporangium mesophilum]